MPIVYDSTKAKKLIDKDSDVVKKINEVLKGGDRPSNKGTYKINNKQCYHAHVTGGNAFCYFWDGDDLHVTAYGEHSQGNKYAWKY